MTQTTSDPLVIGPMGVGQVVDAAFTLMRRHFGYLLVVGAWGMVASTVISVVAETMFGSLVGVDSLSDLIDEQDAAVNGLVSPPYWALTTLSSLASALSYGALLIACGGLIERSGLRMTTAEAYGAALNRVFWTIPLGLVMGMGSVLFLLPPLGIWVFVGWSVALPILFIERHGPLASLGRSRALVKGSWWHTFGVILVTVLVMLVVTLVLGIVMLVALGVMALLGGEGTVVAATLVVTALVSVVSAPIIPAFGVVLLYELRARSEGFDLVQRAQ